MVRGLSLLYEEVRVEQEQSFISSSHSPGPFALPHGRDVFARSQTLRGKRTVPARVYLHFVDVSPRGGCTVRNKPERVGGRLSTPRPHPPKFYHRNYTLVGSQKKKTPALAMSYTGFLDELRKIPPVTRFLCGSSLAVTIPVMMQLLSPYKVIFVRALVTQRFEVRFRVVDGCICVLTER